MLNDNQKASIEAYLRNDCNWGEFQLTEATAKAFAAYLDGYNVLCRGSVGTGKTNTFKALNLGRDWWRNKFKANAANFKSTHSKEVVDLFANSGRIQMLKFHCLTTWDALDITSWCNSTAYMEVLLDDVGTEPSLASAQKQSFDPFPYILERRRVSPCRTHVTTNLTTEQLIGRYGARVADRLCEYFKIVRFEDKSLRRPRKHDELYYDIRDSYGKDEFVGNEDNSDPDGPRWIVGNEDRGPRWVRHYYEMFADC